MRRSQFALVFVALFFIFPAALFAQQGTQTPTAPTRDPQAMSVLGNAVAALGGSAIATIQDTVIQATLTPPQGHAEGPGTATFKTKGAKIRSDATSGSKSGTSIFNNGREFRSSDHGMLPAHSANADHKRIEHLPALMLAQELARNDFSATYVGQESVEGQTVQHIRLFRVSNRNPVADAQLTKNSELNVFVDAKTSRIVKISFPYVAENDWRQSLPMEIFYDDYRISNGIAVPFHQRYFFNGQPAGELQFTSVAINQGTPDSVFNGSQQ
jgi:hypothetical protein